MRLDGFGIFVKDMPTMVKFYRDVLEFDIKEDVNTSNVYLEKDGTLFLLYRRSDFEKMTNKSFSYADKINGHYEIALSVENYEAVDLVFEKVVSKGAIPVLNPTTEPWGQRTCYVSDPEGIKLKDLNRKSWHNICCGWSFSFAKLLSIQPGYARVMAN
ncbi:VOC family protein [Herbivorax sp. ANBcel31]|nr:VOC family protein [Herbivorax sp. ANBcel31]MDQ2088005.1 VOC family protein [Herbivorax sp. ANBcel31]